MRATFIFFITLVCLFFLNAGFQSGKKISAPLTDIGSVILNANPIDGAGERCHIVRDADGRVFVYAWLPSLAERKGETIECGLQP